MTTAEERDDAWWQRWWKKDFSWEGQDDAFRAYWASERQGLVTSPVSGKSFTRFHLPFKWEDGTPTKKTRWTEEDHQALADALEHRLENHRGEDDPAPFYGMVLKRVPNMPMVDEDSPNAASVDFTHAWLQPGTKWQLQVFADTLFDQAQFSGDALFEHSRFGGDARFWRAQFSGNARFEGTQFSGNAGFDGAQFSSIAWFGVAQFSGYAGFEGAQFSGDAWFERTIFSWEALKGHKVLFRDAVAKAGFRFTPDTFPPDPRLVSAAFHGMVFEEIAYFGGAFRQFAAFEGADPRKDIRFESPSPVGRDDVLNDLLQATKDDPQDQDRLLTELIGGAQILQIVSDRYRRREDEQWFHRMELLAKEGLSTTGWFERFLTKAYRWTSDFGGSVGRPIISIFVSLLLFASLFWAWHAPARLECLPVTQGLCSYEGHGGAVTSSITFSARNVFRPFHVWSVPPGRGTAFEDDLLYGGNDDSGLGGLLVRLVSTLQSFFSIVMLFLTALAARRRFQLS